MTIGFVQMEKEMRLIDADKFKAYMQDKYLLFDHTLVDIDAQPAVDAEPVVRCKDCRWGREACGNIECSADLNLLPEYHGYDWYCPNGERRKNEAG